MENVEMKGATHFDPRSEMFYKKIGSAWYYLDDGDWCLSSQFSSAGSDAVLVPISGEQVDNVNHPKHYQSDSGVECIDAIRAALGKEGFIAYCKGNAIKYTWRDKLDNSEDMRKAQWYLNRADKEMNND